jgi:hypothetical protein
MKTKDLRFPSAVHRDKAPVVRREAADDSGNMSKNRPARIRNPRESRRKVEVPSFDP